MQKILMTAISLLLLQTIYSQKIDRTKPPKAGPAPVISIGNPVTYKLSNGITVLIVENHKIPKVNASYFIDAGPITEGTKAGVMELMGGMLNEGSTQRTKAQFDEEVDEIGANVSLGASGGSASALTRYFEKAFTLMAEAMQQPAMKEESFQKLKSQMITGLKASERDIKTISSRVTNALLYGTGHPYGEFTTAQIVNALTLQDVKGYYTKYITPSRGFLVFVGDIKPETAKALAEKAFGKWTGTTLTLPKLAPVANASKTEIDIVDVPTAVQSEIKVTNLVSLPLSDPDYFAVLLANNILGGGSDAYLFKTLREKHGFTYGAYSSISPSRFQSTFSASASVRNDKTDSAVVDFITEINRIRNEKVTEEDLKNTKAEYNGAFAIGMENPGRIAGFAQNIMLYNLPDDFYRTYLQKINAVTVDDIQRVAKKYFTIDNSRIVIAGKASDISGNLKKLGYPVSVYDKDAKLISADTK